MKSMKSFAVLVLTLLTVCMADTVCSARTFFDNTEQAFEWNPPDGWNVLEAQQARELFSKANGQASKLEMSAEYLDTIQYAIVSPTQSFTSNIIVRLENKRFGYQVADLDALKKQLQGMYENRNIHQIVQTVTLLNRSDNKRFLEIMIDNPAEDNRTSAVTIHVHGGQLQANLASKMDSFSSDRVVLISFLERVPFSSYAPSQPLEESDSFRNFLGQLAFVSVVCFLYYWFVRLRRKSRRSDNDKTGNPQP